MCFQCAEVIYSEMLDQNYAVDAVKFCLVVGHSDMFSTALDVLSKVEEVIGFVSVDLHTNLSPDLHLT